MATINNASPIPVLLVMAWLFLSDVLAQFPMACQANLTQDTGVCCPIPNGLIEPCGGAGRGHCVRLPQVNVKYYPEPPEDDERLNWPHRYVQMGCRCEANFYGADCSSCKFGYTGTSCDQKLTLVRRNIADYSPREKRVFRDTVERSKFVNSGLGVVLPPAGSQNTTGPQMVELSIWDMFQYMHYRTSHLPVGDCGDPNSVNFAHSTSNFPVWHRRYMLWVERELRQISDDPDFTLPYWDWIDADRCDVCTNDLVGAPSDNGTTLDSASPFSRWETLCLAGEPTETCGHCDPTVSQGPLRRALTGSYPDQTAMEAVLNKTLYDAFNPSHPDAFRLPLEIVHGLVHDVIGGHMGSLLTAADDPIFLFHHTFVDKLLEVWFSKHGVDRRQYPYSYGRAGSLAEEPMVPFFPPENNIDYFAQSAQFGYEYDTLCLSYQDPETCIPTPTPDVSTAESNITETTSIPDVTETSSDANVTETTSNPNVTETMATQTVTATTSNPNVTETMATQTITETTSNPNVTETMATQTVTDITSNPNVTETMATQTITDTTSNPNVTETMETQTVTETTSNPNVTETTMTSNFTEPTIYPNITTSFDNVTNDVSTITGVVFTGSTSEGPTGADVTTMETTTAPGDDGGNSDAWKVVAIILIVLLVIAIMLLIIALVVWLKKRKGSPGNRENEPLLSGQ